MDITNINLHEVRDRFPIDEPFKEKQKTNSGKVIPFEAIDFNLYKRQASCTCFVTSHTRIHEWIVVIGEGLATCKNTHVEWKIDEPLKSEFIVNEIDTDDEIAYRIIAYMTTGKILIQGKKYARWCDEQFGYCMNKVNEMTKEHNGERAQEYKGKKKTEKSDCEKENTPNKSPQCDFDVVNDVISASLFVTPKILAETNDRNAPSPSVSKMDAPERGETEKQWGNHYDAEYDVISGPCPPPLSIMADTNELGEGEKLKPINTEIRSANYERGGKEKQSGKPNDAGDEAISSPHPLPPHRMTHINEITEREEKQPDELGQPDEI